MNNLEKFVSTVFYSIGFIQGYITGKIRALVWLIFRV